MNRSHFHIILGYIAAAVLFTVAVAGCSSSSLEDSVTGPVGSEVNFIGTLSSGVNATKGMIPLDDANLFTMGVFAGYEEEEETFGPASPANDFIDNVRYTRSFITNPFAGADVCYWPFNGKLSFFAYAPYISSTFLQFSSDYVSGYPRMSYSPTTNVTDQPDFCIASPVLDQHMSLEPIHLVFHHSLSQVLLSANYAGDIPPIKALYVKIDSIRICNVIGKKTVVMSSGTPCFEWQPDVECLESDRTSYLMDRSTHYQLKNLELPKVTNPLTDNFLDLTSTTGMNNGVMYLLPQSMTYGETYLKVSYGYYEMVGSTETLRASASTICPLPAVTWEPTKSYRYKFTINLATNSIVNPTVTVEAWKEVNIEPNPIHIE